MKLNTKIAESLGMVVPDDVEDSESEQELIEPTEMVLVDNDNLPELSDIERTMLIAEKQLDRLIDDGFSLLKEQQEEIQNTEPKYKSRFVEVLSLTRRDVLDGIKQKMDFQLKKRQQRLKEQDFQSGKSGSTTNNVTNNTFFSGTREELLQLLRKENETVEPVESEVAEDVEFSK